MKGNIFAESRSQIDNLIWLFRMHPDPVPMHSAGSFVLLWLMQSEYELNSAPFLPFYLVSEGGLLAYKVEPYDF